MKKVSIVILSLVILISLCGCNKTREATESSLAFKTEYEALNGKENSAGKVHRTVNITDNNPYEKVTPEKLIEMIDNKETFYVYFGDPLCPWCRSVIEKSIEVADQLNIDKIYYIKIWDEEGNEVFRSKYTLDKKNKPELVTPATDEYYTITRAFSNVLKDYTLKTSDGEEINIGEKRIYAPNYVYVENGKANKLVSGISDKQTDSRSELTKEILDDEEKIFTGFFTK